MPGIRAALGSGFLNALCSLESERAGLEAAAYFRHGFHIAVRLLGTQDGG